MLFKQKAAVPNPNPDLAPFSRFNLETYYGDSLFSFYYRAMIFCRLIGESIILGSTEGIFDNWFRKKVISGKL